jgi:PAS domain S-box-containing protein
MDPENIIKLLEEKVKHLEAENQKLREKHSLSQIPLSSPLEEAKEQLRDIQERYKRLVDLLPQTVYETDENGIFTFINQYAEVEFGYSTEEVIGKLSIVDMVAPKQRKLVIQKLQSGIVNRSVGRELSMLRKDGSTFFGLVHYAPIMRNNCLVGLQGIITNIDKQKQILEALRLSEENYHTIFQLANDSIIIHDTETGNIIDANRIAIESYGVSTLVELREFGYWSNKPPYRLEDALQWIRKAHSDGPQVFEWLNKRVDGSFFWEEVHLTSVKILGVERIISISRDITVRKSIEDKLHTINRILKERNEEYAALNEEYVAQNEKLQSALEKAAEADKLKNSFLANMSHEIRTPMNAIMGFSSLLDRGNLPEEKQRYFAQIIRKRSSDLLKIIDDILDISKIEANQIVIKKTNGSIREFLNEIFEYSLTKAQIDAKTAVKLSLAYQLDDSVGLFTDFGRVKQVFFNLIENALKFTQKGSIEIGCQLHSQKTILFYVKDTGTGIAKDNQKIIFERFHQAHSSIEPNFGGTGLGLAISKGLVELLGGTIWVESDLGIGSKFCFTLPLDLIDHLPSNNYTTEPLPISEINATILIVEDDELNANYLKEVLLESNAKLLMASDGQMALDIATKHPEIDLVLLDLRLPDESGLNLIKPLRLLCPNVKIIIQSAYATTEDKALGQNAGSDGYITKPIDPNFLINNILKTLRPDSNNNNALLYQ